EDLLFTSDHEWIRVEDDVITIGITEFAQEQLGDVVYVELPDEGQEIDAEDAFGSVESVKAVSEIYSPVGGTVVEVNELLEDSPEKVNTDPYGDGWMVQLNADDTSALNSLMSPEAYEEYLSEEE
ncbi:MAG: glycine cleavage system protein GcvH, partial [Acidobacteriota bacterium]